MVSVALIKLVQMPSANRQCKGEKKNSLTSRFDTGLNREELKVDDEFVLHSRCLRLGISG